MSRLRDDKDGGTLYRPSSDQNVGTSAVHPARRRQPPRHTIGRDKRNWPELDARFVAALDTDDLRTLAQSLGLHEEALQSCGIGWATQQDLRRIGASGADWKAAYPDGAYTFPEWVGGRIVSHSLRTKDGRKGAPAGAPRGLVILRTLADSDCLCLVVEGASDVAACAVLKLSAVGRPSNSSGAEAIASLLEGYDDVLIVGERDGKRGGAWPGRDGARKVAQSIANAWQTEVPWTLPPKNNKDVRAYLNRRIANGLDIRDDAACRAAGEELLDELRRGARSAKPRKRSQSDVLYGLLADVELFRARDNGADGYARLPISNATGRHDETHKINSKGFRQWLANRYREQTGRTAGVSAVQELILTIEGQAIHGGTVHPVASRLAEHEGVIYLDLVDERWRVVEIRPDSWRIIDAADCPIRFVRREGMLKLPEPQRGGKVDELRELVNVPNDDDWTMVIAWLVAALYPHGPHPVLAINGEQGSAKSTLSRCLRSLIDPNVAPLRRPPKDERDLMITANASWCIAFDNLSSISPRLSDALCCLSTGAAFATRSLYSDDEEKLFVARRPVLLNGIDQVTSRPDLLDRSLSIVLPTILDCRRRDESELHAKFEKARPRILGALLDAASIALAERAKVQLADLPRMADFAKWVTAAERGLGWEPGTFMAAYEANRATVHDMAIESSPVGMAIVRMMRGPDTSWAGPASTLCTVLEGHAADPNRREGWPKSPRAMSDAIRRIAPSLRAIGLNYRPPAPTDKQRIHRIEKVRIRPPEPPELTS